MALVQPVQQGDFVLLYDIDNPQIFRVLSAPTTHSFDFSAIIVKKVPWAFPYDDDTRPGSWTLDGPNICLVESKMDSDHGDQKADLDAEGEATDLDLALEKVQDPEGIKPPSVIMKPHGRDILHYVFQGTCPQCAGSGWICPDCGSPAWRYPALAGECAVDQSCPVCMGYDFALQDKLRVGELEALASKIYDIDAPPSAEKLGELRTTGLEKLRDRFELIHRRRVEMGIPTAGLGAVEKGWFDILGE